MMPLPRGSLRDPTSMVSGREERRDIQHSMSELNSNSTKYSFSFLVDLQDQKNRRIAVLGSGIGQLLT